MLKPIYEDTILIDAELSHVRFCLTHPDRVMDYYPFPQKSFVVEQGKSLICKGAFGCSLIEVIAQSDDQREILLEVSNALLPSHLLDIDNIKKQMFFSMLEKVTLEVVGNQTVLHKQWGDIKRYRYPFLPLELIIKITAKTERKKIMAGWKMPKL